MLTLPEPVPEPEPEPEEEPPERVEMGLVGSLEDADIVFARLSEVGPELRC